MHFPLLAGSGLIATEESGLIIQATLLMLIVIIPVLTLLFYFGWRYRAGNTKARYVPNWEHSSMDELVWWSIPLEIVLVLGALTWSSTHALDPQRPLISSVEPVEVEVIALPWRWLFIYPEFGVASVNFMQIPTETPINFKITADAPMNSFWVPELGGQIYAMTGMVNRLHLTADVLGDYHGLSANYSGEGFAQMDFVVRASSREDFDAWVRDTRRSPEALTTEQYQLLARPSTDKTVYTYSLTDSTLFSTIIEQFGMHHTGTSESVQESRTWPSGPERSLVPTQE